MVDRGGNRGKRLVGRAAALSVLNLRSAQLFYRIRIKKSDASHVDERSAIWSHKILKNLLWRIPSLNTVLAYSAASLFSLPTQDAAAFAPQVAPHDGNPIPISATN